MQHLPDQPHTLSPHPLQAARRRSPRMYVRAVLRTYLRATWRPLWRCTPNVARAWQSLVLSALIVAGRAAQPAHAQEPQPTLVPHAADVTAYMEGQTLFVIGTDADDKVAITSADGNVKINGVDPATGAFASADVASVLIDGGEGNDVIDVSAVTPPLFGNGPMFEIMSGGGDDLVLVSPAGYTYMDGGAGRDVLQVTTDGEIVLSGDGLFINGYERATFNGFEEALLIGGAGNDRMWAQDFGGPVSFVGGAGSDTIYGTAYSDQFNAGTGKNKIIDHTNDDQDRVHHTMDSYITLTDVDLAAGSTVTTFNGFVETAMLVGGAGANTIDASGWSGTTMIVGGPGDDTLLGGRNNDVIDGGDGTDRIEAGAGDDVVGGGVGTDTVVQTVDADQTLTSTRATGHGTDMLVDIERAEVGGGAGNNVLDASGWSGAVQLRGLAGTDTLTGGTGDDLLEGGDGDDTLRGGAGNDTLRGEAGDDTLFWSPGDVLDGGPGNNIVQWTSFLPVLHHTSGGDTSTNE